jgi:hypothetical protein
VNDEPADEHGTWSEVEAWPWLRDEFGSQAPSAAKRASALGSRAAALRRLAPIIAVLAGLILISLALFSR